MNNNKSRQFLKYTGALRVLLFVFPILFLVSCGVYTFKDVSIDYTKIKTIKIGYFENKARYNNPLLSPRLTDQFTQKVASYTKLTRTTNDDAHYQVQGYISTYNVSTSGVAQQKAATNRLTVGAHIIFKDIVNDKTNEFDVSRDFDFSANLSLQEAEGRLLDEVVKNLSDEIFNRIFSNW
ncbi:LPS assembly lipoprotein LptE [Filimonas effusa]|uniref:Lipopolysaccharide-assembly n=1 Tax=Filimonas effusa TaxID=2508721 RepID=A0A4Q1DA81_9BACT|nr:LPS assembly lipoprotein LptE [Filimonas effusa]RXK86302.1 hypothetical protein ESB13_05715 [Filimonas effusa]